MAKLFNVDRCAWTVSRTLLIVALFILSPPLRCLSGTDLPSKTFLCHLRMVSLEGADVWYLSWYFRRNLVIDYVSMNQMTHQVFLLIEGIIWVLFLFANGSFFIFHCIFLRVLALITLKSPWGYSYKDNVKIFFIKLLIDYVRQSVKTFGAVFVQYLKYKRTP